LSEQPDFDAKSAFIGSSRFSVAFAFCRLRVRMLSRRYFRRTREERRSRGFVILNLSKM
jgi:hypothetical protein